MVIPEYPPDTIGGGGVVFQALVQEYIAHHDVQVFTGADSDRSWIQGRRRGTADSVIVNRYPLIPIGRAIPYLRSAPPPNFRAWLQLRNDLADWSPEVAHVHGYGHAFVDLAALILARRGVPYVFTLHGIPTRPSRHNLTIRVAFRAYERFGVGRAIRKAHAITAVSMAAAGPLSRTIPIEVIPNGVSAFGPSNAGRVKHLRERLAIPPGVAVVVGAGRLSVEKGFDVLIRCLDYVEVRQLVCVIAGADAGVGQQLAELAAKVRAGVSVHFLGRQSREVLGDLYAMADVVVVPSREESFGLVALEALACGRRLVASQAGGLGEFLPPEIALLVPRDSVVELASAITTSLARGPLTRLELEQAERLVASHSWHSIALRYQQVMTQVTNT